MPVNLLPNNPYWVWVDELFDGRDGTPFQAGGERDYTRRFRVRVKQVGMASLAVCSCPGLPMPYSPYQSGNGLEYDLNALCIALHAEEENKGDFPNWIVTATYSTKMPPGGKPDLPGWPSGGKPGQPHEGGQSTNPELTPPDIEWDFESSHEAPQQDAKGRPFMNSARQPFTPAPTFDVARPVLVYSRNELVWSRRKATDYAFAVNSDPFLGCNPSQCQCMPPKAVLRFLGNLTYWRVTYRFRFVHDLSKDSWQPTLLDQGVCRLQDSPGAPRQGEPTPIIRNQHPITHPVLLDGNGQPKRPTLIQFVGPGGVIVRKEVIEPVFLDFDFYKPMPFGRLLLRGLS